VQLARCDSRLRQPGKNGHDEWVRHL
jgi:hypothetical protein